MAGWGGVARRGAAKLAEDDRGAGRSGVRPAEATPPERSWEHWVREPEPASSGPVPSEERRPAEEEPLPEEVQSELRGTGGRRAASYIARLSAATRAYGRDRYEEALRILVELAREVPEAASVRELAGLTFYRLGRWRQAVRHLRAFSDLTGSLDQYPVLADCERALGHHKAVEHLWEELRSASAGAELTSEGRLVMAGSLSDRGLLAEAIALLQAHAKPLRHPAERHLRTWYALADLYEKAGDLPRARALFSHVAAHDPSLGDAKDRAEALS